MHFFKLTVLLGIQHYIEQSEQTKKNLTERIYFLHRLRDFENHSYHTRN